MASTSCAPIPAPVRINWHAVDGPVLHYELLTAAELDALDLIPPAYGDTKGAVVKRHRGGFFSVRARIAVIASGNTAYKTFRARVLGVAA